MPVLRPGKKRRALRLFFATDIHGSEVCFRKFLAAAKVYGADVLLLGGDFAGKGVVPVLRRGDLLAVTQDGQQVTAPAAEYDRLAGLVTRRGCYPVLMDDDELAGLGADSAALDALFKAEITAQARRWCELAAQRLDPAVRCIITPGNDDPVAADAIFASSGRVEFPALSVCEVGPFAMASIGVVPTTPWNTERECPDDELARRIDELLAPHPADARWIFNFHSPPYASGLDDAPELDAGLRPVIRHGRPSVVPVGSRAVRDAIRSYQPVLALHGHIHESPGVRRIGRSLCINPGSDYSAGVLCGALIDFATDGTLMDYLLTTG